MEEKAGHRYEFSYNISNFLTIAIINVIKKATTFGSNIKKYVDFLQIIKIKRNFTKQCFYI